MYASEFSSPFLYHKIVGVNFVPIVKYLIFQYIQTRKLCEFGGSNTWRPLFHCLAHAFAYLNNLPPLTLNSSYLKALLYTSYPSQVTNTVKNFKIMFLIHIFLFTVWYNIGAVLLSQILSTRFLNIHVLF